MSGLKELRNRITSVKSTRQITSAMKMVAAAKLKGAQDRIVAFRPYAEKMQDIACSLSSLDIDKISSDYILPSKSDKVLIVLFTSNRGLCGGFNNNIFKKAYEWAGQNYAYALNNDLLSFYCIGKKGSELVKRRGLKLDFNNNTLLDKICFANSNKIAEHLMQLYSDGVYGKIDIAFNHFKNAGVQIQTVEKFLPVPLHQKNHRPADYLFEPGIQEIMLELIPQTLRIHFYKALQNSFASEQGARMTAMHQATDNASELIKELTLQYNKARQAAITSEILEITSGAEALKS